MMKKILTVLLVLLLCGCNASNNEVIEEKEPETFNPSTVADKQVAYYVYPIADKDGNMVIPLSTECGIICTDKDKAKYMQDKFEETIIKYHILLDPAHEFEGVNNVKTINDNYGLEPVKVNPELIELIDNALTLSELTNGYFNPTIGQVSDVWKGLFNEEHKNNDPEKEVVSHALTASIPYKQLRNYIILDKENSTVTFKKYEDSDLNVIIDLGAFSKGYVMDMCYKELLKYKSGFLITAGGSSIITYVEDSQTDLKWRIGIKNPNTGDSCFIISVKNIAMSSSGDEEQFFINEEGIRRHHILNPFTGYPENYYRGISLVADDFAGVLDGLTTAIYSADDKEEIINNVSNYYNIDIKQAYITEDDNKNLLLTYNKGIEDILFSIDDMQITDITKG